MSTLPVWWVMNKYPFESKRELFATAGYEQMIRLADLDALREGLAALVTSDFSSFNEEWLNDDTDLPRDEWLAQRLLAMLPPREGANVDAPITWEEKYGGDTPHRERSE